MTIINESTIVQITLQCQVCENMTIKQCSESNEERLKELKISLELKPCEFCKISMTSSIRNGELAG